MTLETFFKIAPGILGVLTATLRLLPGAATAARRKHSEDAAVSLNMRVRHYSAPMPWSDRLERRLKSREGKERIQTRSVWVCSLAIPGVAFAAFVYVVLAQAEDFPWWSIAIAIALAITIVIVLAKLLIGLQRNPNQYTGVPAADGSICVDGRREDVDQYCLAALRGMGARLIGTAGLQCEPISTESYVYAATGVSIIGDLFVGERIVLVIRSDGNHHQIDIESTKLDFLTPSRCKKNVIRFLELWAFYPANSH